VPGSRLLIGLLTATVSMLVPTFMTGVTLP